LLAADGARQILLGFLEANSSVLKIYIDVGFPRPRRGLWRWQKLSSGNRITVPASEGFHMRKYVLLVIAMLFSLASSANAATILLKDYKSPKNEAEKAFSQLYLDGIKEGLITFNSQLTNEGRQPLFCLPGKLALTIEQAEEIMLRDAKKVPNPDQYPISIILLHGLKDTFPCDEKH
jgi:hypothetical protein